MICMYGLTLTFMKVTKVWNIMLHNTRPQSWGERSKPWHKVKVVVTQGMCSGLRCIRRCNTHCADILFQNLAIFDQFTFDISVGFNGCHSNVYVSRNCWIEYCFVDCLMLKTRSYNFSILKHIVPNHQTWVYVEELYINEFPWYVLSILVSFSYIQVYHNDDRSEIRTPKICYIYMRSVHVVGRYTTLLTCCRVVFLLVNVVY